MSIIPDPCKWSWVCGSLLPNLINVVTPVLLRMEFGFGIIVRPGVVMERDRELNSVSRGLKSKMPVSHSQGPIYRKAMQEAGF